MAKELGRFPVESIKEVIERITTQLTERVSYNDKLTYVSLIERKLKRPINWSEDEIFRIYDNPIVKNNTIFISSIGIKEGAIKVVKKNNDFYCRFYNYDSSTEKYIFDQEDVYSTARCIVEIFGGCADMKINIEEAYKNLGCAMALQEAEEYFKPTANKSVCIKTLKALDSLTEGMASVLIRKLHTNPQQVKTNLRTYSIAKIEKRKAVEKQKNLA